MTLDVLPLPTVAGDSISLPKVVPAQRMEVRDITGQLVAACDSFPDQKGQDVKLLVADVAGIPPMMQQLVLPRGSVLEDDATMDGLMDSQMISLVLVTKGHVPGLSTTFEVVSAGEGSKRVLLGSKVTVSLTVSVQGQGTELWSTESSGNGQKTESEPFTYVAGVDKLIEGWDQGCLGMRVGEERRLVIPAEDWSRSTSPTAWGIPKDAALEFYIKCLEIESAEEANIAFWRTILAIRRGEPM